MRRLPAGDGFREAVLEGLSHRPRRIPCRFLYDTVGSALFDRITELPTYHLTRAETALLTRHAGAIAAQLGPGVRVAELGAGSMRKTRLLLAALKDPADYVPIDVAGDALAQAARKLAAEFPSLTVLPLVADFNHPLALPPGNAAAPLLVFFPGSTIGNLRPAEACGLLARLARMTGPRGWVLVGADPVRDPDRLHAAYDDADGITAAFIRNVLARANRELDADFDLEHFDHNVVWNARESRVEISLVANGRRVVTVAGQPFAFRSGDAIAIEECYKYSVEQFHWLARQAGLFPAATWVDDSFSLHLLKAAPSG